MTLEGEAALWGALICSKGIGYALVAASTRILPLCKEVTSQLWEYAAPPPLPLP